MPGADPTYEPASVPALTGRLTWWESAELLLLRRVAGPWRRRRGHPPLPPPLSGEETARRLLTLPISSWTYDFEPGVRHLGPMAQDFAAAFGLGRTNRKINMVDANGVAVVALQSLARRVVALEEQVARLTAAAQAPPAVSSGRQTDAGNAVRVGDGTGSRPADDGRPTMTIDDTTAADATPDDTAGHRIYATSDRTVKEDIAPVTWESDAAPGDEPDDTVGHKIYSTSDRTVKEDIAPVTWESDTPATPDDDDVEGHARHF